MNTTLSTALGRHDHPPQPAREQSQRLVRRVSLLDRAALRIGVALITWGRRPLAVDSRERLARRAQQHAARFDREQAAEKWLRLNVPRL